MGIASQYCGVGLHSPLNNFTVAIQHQCHGYLHGIICPKLGHKPAEFSRDLSYSFVALTGFSLACQFQDARGVARYI